MKNIFYFLFFFKCLFGNEQNITTAEQNKTLDLNTAEQNSTIDVNASLIKIDENNIYDINIIPDKNKTLDLNTAEQNSTIDVNATLIKIDENKTHYSSAVFDIYYFKLESTKQTSRYFAHTVSIFDNSIYNTLENKFFDNKYKRLTAIVLPLFIKTPWTYAGGVSRFVMHEYSHRSTQIAIGSDPDFNPVYGDSLYDMFHEAFLNGAKGGSYTWKNNRKKHLFDNKYITRGKNTGVIIIDPYWKINISASGLNQEMALAEDISNENALNNYGHLNYFALYTRLKLSM